MVITYSNSKFATQLYVNMHCQCFLEFQYQNSHLNKRFLSWTFSLFDFLPKPTELLVCMRWQHNCGYPRVKIVAANVLVHFVDLTLTVWEIHKIDQIQDNTGCYDSSVVFHCGCPLSFPE